MKKKIGWIVGLLVCCLVVGRIVYVNITYPYAGVHQKEQGDTVSYGGKAYVVEDAKLYTKDSWLSYIESAGINEEAKENNIMHTGLGDSENINNYDYYVGYNPESDYRVIVLKLHFQDESMDEKQLEQSFSVVRRLNVAQEFFDSYYSAKLQEQLEEHGAGSAEDGKTMVRVYMISKEVKHLYLQSLEFGNNTMVRLKPEVVE